MSTTTDAAAVAPIRGWEELRRLSSSTATGAAVERDRAEREAGRGPAHVRNTLRLFDRANDVERPRITFYRDHAGWCPYCEKTILLIEEKRVPVNVEMVPMRSYGDKPREFLAMVPNGLLPALTVETDDGRTQTITESQVIMELLDRWHPEEDGYRPMMPTNPAEKRRFDALARLERELFSWWCTFLFRPEGGPVGGGGFNLGNIFNMDKSTSDMSASFRGFVDCLTKVDQELRSTKGPWFLESFDYPTMIDLIFVSHIERMLASCAYWKGFRIRGTGQFPGIDAWFDAFDQRESYLAFKSDFYTNIMDIPPQYGPAYTGGNKDFQPALAEALGGGSWHLPLPHDDPVEPLYAGPPLPVAVLEANGLANGEYRTNERATAVACRHFAGHHLVANGPAVARFAARGGAKGAANVRRTFQAPLADPYADPDSDVLDEVGSVLRAVAAALLVEDNDDDAIRTHETVLEEDGHRQAVREAAADKERDVAASLAYLRDRVGVPRDMPLAAARQLRAHLNWAIDAIATL